MSLTFSKSRHTLGDISQGHDARSWSVDMLQGQFFSCDIPILYDKVLSREQNFVPATVAWNSAGTKWLNFSMSNRVHCSCFILFSFWKKLLESIAQVTGGMYVMVQNMDELSTFFKRQVLLSRFIAKFAHGKLLSIKVTSCALGTCLERKPFNTKIKFTMTFRKWGRWFGYFVRSGLGFSWTCRHEKSGLRFPTNVRYESLFPIGNSGPFCLLHSKIPVLELYYLSDRMTNSLSGDVRHPGHFTNSLSMSPRNEALATVDTRVSIVYILFTYFKLIFNSKYN